MNAKIILPIAIAMILATPVGSDVGGGSTASAEKPEPVPAIILDLIENDEYERAAPKLKSFLDKEKKSADGWNLLGYSQRKTGQLDDSLRSYQRALKLDKKHLGANEYIGELYLLMDEPKQARKHLRKLSRYCGDCEQFQDLKSAIDVYDAGS